MFPDSPISPDEQAPPGFVTVYEYKCAACEMETRTLNNAEEDLPCETCGEKSLEYIAMTDESADDWNPFD